MAGGMPKPPLFFVSKGLSQAVSAIVITLIAISLMGIVFTFGNTYLQSQSRNPKINILDASIVKLGSSVIVRYSIGNTGSEQVTLTSIRVEGAGCSQTLSKPLPPGQKHSDSFLCNVNLSVGSKYVITAKANTVDGREVGDAIWVRVEV
ncbi:MAG: hypothetical protein QXT14_08395 [Candidatus Bathyarchaeia archaeon]